MAQERRGQDRLRKIPGAPESVGNTRTTIHYKDRPTDKESVKYRTPDQTERLRQRENDLYERQNS